MQLIMSLWYSNSRCRQQWMIHQRFRKETCICVRQISENSLLLPSIYTKQCSRMVASNTRKIEENTIKRFDHSAQDTLRERERERQNCLSTINIVRLYLCVYISHYTHCFYWTQAANLNSDRLIDFMYVPQKLVSIPLTLFFLFHVIFFYNIPLCLYVFVHCIACLLVSLL